MVATNDELSRSIFQTGNNYTIRPSEFSCRLNEFNHVDLPYMAGRTFFVNQKQSQLALVEQLKTDEFQGYNEKGQCYHLDATHSQNYPIIKNQVGALQQKSMPWNLKNSAYNYGGAGLVAMGLSAIL